MTVEVAVAVAVTVDVICCVLVLVCVSVVICVLVAVDVEVKVVEEVTVTSFGGLRGVCRYGFNAKPTTSPMISVTTKKAALSFM